MRELKLKACGKINLGLDVLAKRPDGYHEVRMIMQTVDVCDELFFRVIKEHGIRFSVEGADDVPADHTNLAWKAIALLTEEFGIREGLEVRLIKRIPAAAGMAGGSSDCAAALVAVNQLFELGLTREELMERGVKLGADVPYCLLGGTALAEGIGERLTPLPPMPDCCLVIAKPDISISTPFIYRNLKVNELEMHPDIDGMCRAIKTGDLNGVTDRFGNVLETVAIPCFPQVGVLKEALAGLGAKGVLMSGSGPTVFAVYETEEAANKAAKELQGQNLAKQIFVTRPYQYRMEGTHGE